MTKGGLLGDSYASKLVVVVVLVRHSSFEGVCML